jgi:hypothetical protein
VVTILLREVESGRCEVCDWDLSSGDECWDRGYKFIV